MDTPTLLLIAGIVIVLVIAVAAVIAMQRNRSRRLKERFGPEYRHAVEHAGSRSKAEAELLERQKRVERLHIKPLSPTEAARFSQTWKALQARFVDNPKAVVIEADQLVHELMQKRGYPMGDFERRAADISVDHPAVVDHYRAAQAVVLRDDSDTERLREAVVHYRILFDELLEVRESVHEPAPAR
jgi:hypothetical protein